MTLGTIDSLLGSLWFAGLCLLAGYLCGHLFPLNKLAGLFRKG
jgi:hypothetical protein